jgi:hypothetical protein
MAKTPDDTGSNALLKQAPSAKLKIPSGALEFESGASRLHSRIAGVPKWSKGLDCLVKAKPCLGATKGLAQMQLLRHLVR